MDSELNYHLQVIGRASVLAGNPKKISCLLFLQIFQSLGSSLRLRDKIRPLLGSLHLGGIQPNQILVL